MTFHTELASLTAPDRQWLVTAPIIEQALGGQISKELYVAFLTQAYHHVRHTVPLMMAAGSRLAASHPWMLAEMAHYIEEEIGHDEWILNDIGQAGGDRLAAQRSLPSAATDAMVGFAYDVVNRRNPIGFFGMVYVLEGTSVALALRAADRIQQSLGLPPQALTYLRSHGELDQQHVEHLAGILNRLDHPADRDAVVQAACTFFWLYGNVFRALGVHATLTSPLAERKIA
jgi:pyrroloquinoline quinone (PQQ) biosynthesis protein C